MRLGWALCLCFLTWAGPGPARAQAPASAPVSAPGAQALVPCIPSPDGRLTFARGRLEGLNVGRNVVLLDGDRPLCLGRVTVLSEHFCTVEPDGPRPGAPNPRLNILLLPLLDKLRDRGVWPPGAVLSGKVGPVNAPAQTAALTGDGAKLLRRGDSVLLWQGGLPIARGDDLEYPNLDPAKGSILPVVHLVALVAGRDPAAGDDWTLIRSDDPAGWRTAVLQVTREPAEDIVLLAANERDGVRLGMTVDFFRTGQFIARGEVTEVGRRLTEVHVMPAMGRQPIQMSDLARIYNPAPRQGRIFRLDGMYALTSLPESSGVQVGQSLGVYREGTRLGSLAAEAVKEGYSAGTLTMTAGQTPQLWDEVYLGEPPRPTARLLKPTAAETIWHAERVSPQSPRPGQFYGLLAPEGCIGLATPLWTDADHLLLWLLPTWQSGTPSAGQNLLSAD